MIETVMRSTEYRGYRLTEVRRVFSASQRDITQYRWRVTRVDGDVENIIDEAPSLEEAKAKVDKAVAK